MMGWISRSTGKTERPVAGRRRGKSNGASRSGLTRKPETPTSSFVQRSWIFSVLMLVGAGALLWKAYTLQLVDSEFLKGQGDARSLRVATVAAHRGRINDRAGDPLAVSTPVDSVWVNPKEIARSAEHIPTLAKALAQSPEDLAQRITSNSQRNFLYVARRLQPSDAARVRKLDIPGVHLEREYRRYYPAAEVTGHLLGFTDIDDNGQEGLERAYNHWLAGEDGAKRVIQDNLGRTVQTVESIKPMRAGRDLALSIDMRVQYLAYRELKAAIQTNRARSGSVVVLDVDTGEVLAMVNQPTFNPNDRSQLKPAAYKNRAAMDLLEPGSTIKPFVVAAALSSGQYTRDSIIDTSPGMIKVGNKLIEDKHPLGQINLHTALARSSNVAMTQLAINLGPQVLHDALVDFGFGRVTGSGFPGESAGLLSKAAHWRPITTATVSYGYGLSVTPLQLAHAYATLGSLGVQRPVSFTRTETPAGGQRVIDTEVARDIIDMLEGVVTDAGTGLRAAVPGYRVAGKTGTAWKASAGGYATNRYMSVFAGLAPASDPRLAVVVVIDEPSAGKFYGGDVAAPVFATVVGDALRLLGEAPDAPLDDFGDELPEITPAFARNANGRSAVLAGASGLPSGEVRQ